MVKTVNRECKCGCGVTCVCKRTPIQQIIGLHGNICENLKLKCVANPFF
jgi:hypothetical protein